MFNSVLVVCVGNICRSPLGEARIKQLAPSLKVSSAGVQAMVGWPADPESQRVALAHGMDLSQHKARQLTAAICNDHDLILVMEDIHVDSVLQICPAARGKVMVLGRWSNGQAVPDPYRKDASEFDSAYALIDQFAQQWQSKLHWK